MKIPLTFVQYITRKEGLGRTGWFSATVIIAAMLCLGVFSFIDYPEPLWWVPGAIGCAMLGIMIGGTLANWQTDVRRWSADPANNHYPDVCENCVPPRMVDGGPITVLEYWYAATEGITRGAAVSSILTMTSENYAALQREHRAYMDAINAKRNR